MKPSQVLALLLLLTSAAGTQSKLVLPESHAQLEGNTKSQYPFHYSQGRLQQLWRADQILNAASGVLLSMHWRRDNTGTLAGYDIKAATLPSITIRIGHTPIDYDSFSATFAQNEGNDLTVVFSGSLNLPYQPKVPRTGAFNITVQFARPFVLLRSKGNLLFDAVCSDTKRQYTGHWIDAHELRSYADYRLVGYSGTTSWKQRPLLSVAQGSKGIPGGRVLLQIPHLQKQVAGLGFLGLSDSSWGPLPLPLDLGPFGMPANQLYTGMLAFASLQVTPTGSTWSAAFSAPIPAMPELGGQHLWFQSLLLDGGANPAGLVFTNALDVELGGGPVTSRAVFSTNPDAKSGILYPASKAWAPVVQFSGGF